MSRRLTAVGWGILVLLVPACAGPSRPISVPAPMPSVVANPPAPSVYTALGKSGYTPMPVARVEPKGDQIATANPNPPEQRYQFTRPPTDPDMQVTAAPRELPVKLTTLDPEEKVIAKSSPKVEPIREDVPPYPVGNRELGIGNRDAKPVSPRDAKSQAKLEKIEALPVSVAKSESPTVPTPDSRFPIPDSRPSNVIAPDWPTIDPATNAIVVKSPASLSVPVRGGNESSPRSPLEEIKAPPYPTLQSHSVSSAPSALTMPTTPVIPVEAIAPLKIEPIAAKSVMPDLQPRDPREQRETIRESVKETLKELPAEAPRKEIPPPIAPSVVAESPLVLAIRAYQAKDAPGAMRHLQQYDPRNRELLMSLMPLLVRLGEGSLSSMSPEELSAHLDQLQGASAALKSRAALKAETVCFCKRVMKYGKYDAVEPDHIYQPLEPIEVYFELRNFTWESRENAFEMRLGSTLEIRDSKKKVVWRRDLTTTDSRQTPPSDYYLVYRFTLPELPPGAYTLDVQVVDQLDAQRRNVWRALDLKMSGSKP